MSDIRTSRSPMRNPESKTHQILRGSSGRTEEANLPAPLRWIVELIQRLIAVMFIVVGNSIKMVFSSDDKPHGAGRHQMEADAKRAMGKDPNNRLEAKDLLPKSTEKDD